MKAVLDDKLNENNRLREQKARDQDELARARELRKVRKHEAEELAEKCKRLKGLQIDVMEKGRQAKERMMQKESEL